MGFEPTGETITIPGLAVDRIRDGRVVGHWKFPDTATAAQRAGGGGREDVAKREPGKGKRPRVGGASSRRAGRFG
jgi:hypothetical protein